MNDLKQDVLRVEEKVDGIKTELTDIAVILAKQEVNIDIHIKRTNLLEESLDHLRKELKPVERHVAMMHGAAKLIGVMAVLAAIVKAIVEIYKLT